MKAMNLNFAKCVACIVLVAGLSASALASCGDSLSAMAAQAASRRESIPPNATGLRPFRRQRRPVHSSGSLARPVRGRR